ncbi:MAG: amino acid permease [Ignavibacteriae bacterium]|nr:amino acid permease [Ignavibacteriota bacterium]
MKLLLLVLLNVGVVALFIYLFRKKNLLSYFSGGRWWLTWLSIAVITLMDELTSIFYAPAEAHRFIGSHAIAFIAITSLLMRFLSSRMVEIAEILEHHHIRGGGVYSFSYLVLGPTLSFIAVASILVDYILTACISTVSAVENGLTFITLTQSQKYIFQFAIVWGIAGLNILGVRENARFTFGIFFVVALVMLSLLASGLYDASPESWRDIGRSYSYSSQRIFDEGVFGGFAFIVVLTSGCILAYSGIESVVQTAGLVKSWRDIGKAYIFLALTTGLFTPLLSSLVLSSGLDPAEHETDLITQYAAMLNGVPFGLLVGVIASVALVMAVNTAYVASSELMERVAHRYSFHWIIKTNKRQSLYRIHLASAIFFTLIIIITSGSQKILAEMYALGLVASFTINMGSLLFYRYFKGTNEVRAYNTSRTGTLIIFMILAGCFVYLAMTKPYGVTLWLVVTVFFLSLGFLVARKRSPERLDIEQTDTPMEMILALAEASGDKINVYFKRPNEEGGAVDPSVAYISFYSPRAGIPPRVSANHFRFQMGGETLYDSIVELLNVFKYELSHKEITFHFGWPLSSWIDRFSTGVMVYSIMKLPKQFPEFNFMIDYFGKKSA